MAHQAEPMDIDSDFDNKENSLHHNNVLPFTEKGYEELDVSELNMKLRYSLTPASSPMSKSYTANCVDNRSLESGDDTLNVTINENSNLTRSLNSNMSKNDSVVKSLKALPLQTISTEPLGDNSRSTSVLRPLDTTVTQDNANVTIAVSRPNDIDENLSLLSSSSSAVQTPEATTPTKNNVKNDGGSSPIMRGIKSVLNMFRSSQSPIPPADSGDIVKPDILSPVDATLSADEAKSHAVLASTPISTHRKKETSPTKRNSPHKESIVFNEDLEKELEWKDETTILFSQERIPIHKLFFQHAQTVIKNTNQDVELPTQDAQDDMNSTVEYMDTSYNDSIRDSTMTDTYDKTNCTFTGESDAEFVDCETTFTKNDSLLEDNDKTPVNDKTQDLELTKEIETASTTENTSASRLKQIILNTTQDILDATLSITPEDLIPEALLKSRNKSSQDMLDQQPESEIRELITPSEIELEKANKTIDSTVFVETQDNLLTLQENLPALNQTVDVSNLSVDCSADLNVTMTAENVIQSILSQEVETTNSMTNLEYMVEPNVTKIIEKISSETVTFDSKHNILENLDSTINSETFTQNEKHIEGLQRQSINDNDHNFTQNITQDIEPIKIDLNTTNVSEFNSSNMAETANTAINNPETLEEIVNKSLPNPDGEGKSSPIKEASMTELAAEIPLPDEDDLNRELNLPADQTSTYPNSLPLDLVDNIKEQADITEIIYNQTIEKEIMEVEANNEDKTVLSVPRLNTSNFECGDNIQNETVTLDPEIMKGVPEGIIDNINSDRPLLTEEPQVVNIDVLPEIPSINYMETESIIDQVQPDTEIINKTETATECLNETVTDYTEENKRVSQAMDINESVIGPLPDIIKQTNTVSSVENFVSALDIPESVVLEQPTILSDNLGNVANDVICPEIVPEAAHNVVPELLSDVSIIPTHANELTEVIREKLPICIANDEIAKSVTDSIATEFTEEIPVAINCVTDTQLNYVDVIPTTPLIPESENLPLNSDIAVSSDIKTEDDEIVLSENNSPFVSVVAEDILGITPEENIDVLNVDHRLTTAGKVVFTPPASPPIASKGYNFNFDEIDDPFATKTKIRVSPSSDTPTKAVESTASSRSVEKPIPKKEIMNRRKSQTERKKPVAPKRKFNSTFSGAVHDKTVTVIESPAEAFALEPSHVTIEDKLIEETKIIHDKTETAIASPAEAFAVCELNLESPANVALEPSNVTIEDKLIEEAKIVHHKTVTAIESQAEAFAVSEFNLESPANVALEPSNVTIEDKLMEEVDIVHDKIVTAIASPAKAFTVGEFNLESPANVALEPSNVTIEDKLVKEAKIVHGKTLDVVREVHILEQELKPEIEQPVIMSSSEAIETESATILAKDSKSSSSSEQSAYFSAGASSNESFHSRNVFNIPEIDDKNFNPFATKSKMRQSPPPNLSMENPFATKSKMRNSPDASMILPHNDEIVKVQDNPAALPDDKMETELMEKDGSVNVSNTTTSSKATDEENGTIKEVNTEDEDTIEGPFLEAEDLNAVDKMSDFDGENIDMMQFNDLPTQENDENGDNGELFIDAEAFEFLLNQNKSNTVVDSGKESLFLKFDPLFAKRMSSITSESLVASLNKLQKRQSTPTKAPMPEKEVKSPIAEPSNLNITQEMDISHNLSEEFNEDLNITVSKPMMVVPPAVNPVTPRNKSLTPNRSNRRSITFTSPAMAVIDRLLSLSGNSSFLHDTTVTQATREQNEADLALIQLRELLAEKEASVHSLRSESKELKDKLSSLESHLKSLEDESQDRLKKINNLNDRLAEKTKINRSMAAVVEEYERTIASLISEIAQDKKRHAEERAKLINERDEQTAHLASMEVSFSDLHSKYEKSKQVILNCKANEDAYKKSIKAFEENLNKMQNNYELLKQHATSKLNHANQELEKMNRSHEAEVLKLNAMIKRKELHITSLEESLTQKTKANDELTAICDELINKVG